MSGSAKARRGGTPSTTQPIAGPWLSPQEVKRNSVPNVLPLVGSSPLPPGEEGDGVASRSHDRDVGRVDGLHADDMIAAVDVVGLAGDAGGKVGKEVDAGSADLLDRDVALQRCVVLVPLQYVAEVADAARRERLDGARRNRVDTDVAAAEIDREITYRRFERGLGDAHHVVVGHHPLGA